MLKGIEACIDKECIVSSVALVYSCIDSLAALTRPKTQLDTTKQQFIDWVGKYFDLDSKLKCTAEDLYGARCGVLHTYSSESGFRRSGKANPVFYCWRNGPSADAQIPMPKNSIEISIEDLFDELRRAVKSFFEDLEHNSELGKKVSHHKRDLLCYRPFTNENIAFRQQ